MATPLVINLGTQPNDQTGDPANIAFGKCNTNFTQLYSGQVPFTSAVIGPPGAGVAALTINGVAGTPPLMINPAGGNAVIVTGAAGNPANVQINAVSGQSAYFTAQTLTYGIAVFGINDTASTDGNGIPAGAMGFGTANGIPLALGTSGATRVTVSNTGTVSMSASFGCNGASPPTQTTGWGTPTGQAVVANFNGASGTLVNCSNAIAEILTILKAYGMIGA